MKNKKIPKLTQESWTDLKILLRAVANLEDPSYSYRASQLLVDLGEPRPEFDDNRPDGKGKT